MKLKQLTEDKELSRTAENNLVVNVAEISYGVPEGGETQVSNDVIYIISDVPQLSKRQFSKLRNVSLRHESEVGHRGSAISMYQINPTESPHGRKLHFKDYPGQKEVIKLPWKQFVTKMIKDYPYESEDDFDE